MSIHTLELRTRHAVHPATRRVSSCTFHLKHADVYGTTRSEWVLALIPETLTLITRPDHSHHLLLDQMPVPHHWSEAHCELRFTSASGPHPLQGHLSLTPDHLRAYGTLLIAGQGTVVDYHVEPRQPAMELPRAA